MCASATAFVADTYIQKTKKLYIDTRTQRNLSKMNDDLIDVQKIMTQNIQEVSTAARHMPPHATSRAPSCIGCSYIAGTRPRREARDDVG